LRSRWLLLTLTGLVVAAGLSASCRSFAAWQTSTLPASQTATLPAWLAAHIGYGDGQIAPVVLDRARALYLQKRRAGTVRNPCYFAMDATKPNDLGDGLGHRFYIICESSRVFRAIPAGHGGGWSLPGIGSFANGRSCAKNFGNALDSKLTAGGDYITAETKPSFKGYYRISASGSAPFIRTFIQFNGQGETANARQRKIGGHPAELLRGVCLRKYPSSPYANREGYVPFGTLVVYSGGRSDGCTSWSSSDARQIIPLVKDDPTTLYIYPESRDIKAIAQAVSIHQPLLGADLYWNSFCLKRIGFPKFWPKEFLEPILARYQNAPQPPPRPFPVCKGP